MGIRNSRVRHIGEFLNDMFETEGLVVSVTAVDVCAEWPNVVGNFISTRSSVSCKDGVLYVKCASSVVAKQLTMNRDGLRSALNAKVGRDVVTKIIIK